ncbi:MAG TPA: hypothetical protein VET87_20785 [Rubrivivax sp.]|nr:hypothetical protein [Rubrivivax sp.]
MEQGKPLLASRGEVGLRQMGKGVADELLLVVTVATVLLGRRALTLAFVEDKVGQAAEFAQVSDGVG